jgi:hypothetical protein
MDLKSRASGSGKLVKRLAIFCLVVKEPPVRAFDPRPALSLCACFKTAYENHENALVLLGHKKLSTLKIAPWLKPILTRRISRSAIHKKDIEKVAQAVAGQASFSGS